jgi:mannose-1-phosphate guanylyltransferase
VSDPGLPPALILAAGQGTRLGELGRRRAKALVEIGGRPLLDLQLDHLAREGVGRAVVNAHHHAEQIVGHVRRYRGTLEVTVLVESRLLGTAGAAVNALEALAAETFVVVYGDVLIFEPLRPVIETHGRTGATATLCVYEYDDTRGKGVIAVDDYGFVTNFAEKDPTRTGPGLVNAGLYVIDSSLLSGLPRDTFLDFGHDVFPAALRAGHRLHIHRIPSPVLDIGTPADLARATGMPVD